MFFQDIHSNVITEQPTHVTAHFVSLGIYMSSSLVCGRTAAPAAAERTILVVLLPGHKAGSTFAAFDFTGKHIAVGMSGSQLPHAHFFFFSSA